jgi:hydroxyacylglutathione hydrolase
MKLRWVILLLLIVALVLAFNDRRMLAVRALAMSEGGEVPALLDPENEGADVRWADDYFTIQDIAENTFAIGEPRYLQQNFSYLIIGDDRALLFDAGPGVRDIRSIAEGLTDKPITFLPSHLHYDHVGNDVTFDRIALLDVPATRDRADGNTFTSSDRQHLGFFEGKESPTWEISEWITPDSEIDLGGRVLSVIYTPGHTDDSVSLYDTENDMVFSGDYLYPGPLYAFLPNSSMGDYLRTTGPLVENLTSEVVFYGAHRAGPPGVPVLAYGDLTDLHRALQNIRDGELAGQGLWPQEFAINDRLTILAEPRLLQDWN